MSNTTTPVLLQKPVCDRCGSDDVAADSAARWNIAKQGWDVSNVFDDGHGCDSCGEECGLNYVDLTPEEAAAYTNTPDAADDVPSVNEPVSLLMTHFALSFDMMNELDEYLRDIRAENLDGSEDALGTLLERSLTLRLKLQSEMTAPASVVPFVGEEHPRYNEWRDEVAGGNTVLGLAEWLDHNPSQDDIREAIAKLEAERAELASGISATCDSEYDREGRAALARWDDEHGAELAALKSQLH